MRSDSGTNMGGRRALLNDIFASIKENFGDVAAGLAEIVRSEGNLAKTELRRESDKFRRALPLLGIGALLGGFALGLILLTAVYALALVVPAWSAALIVGIAAAITAAVTIRFGWKRVAAVDLKPRETIESVKENVVWLKNRLS